MFVIIQCRNTLSEADKKKGVVERLGVTLRHAGVAITITSITNFIAFGIGATTAMPALQSFCIYASIGILSIFFFQVTILVPLLELVTAVPSRTLGSQRCWRWTSTGGRAPETPVSAVSSTPTTRRTTPGPASGPPPSASWPR